MHRHACFRPFAVCLLLFLSSSSWSQAPSPLLERITHWGYLGCGIAFMGNHVCVGDDSVLKVIDVKDPAKPMLVGQVDLGGTINAVETKDKLCFAACQNTGLQIVDLSYPPNPRIRGAGFTKFGFSAEGLTVSGSRVCVLYRSEFSPDWQIRVIDVSDPDHPRVISIYNPYSEIEAFTFHENSVFIFDSNYVTVLDISNPNNPVRTEYEYYELDPNHDFGFVSICSRNGPLLYVNYVDQFHVIDTASGDISLANPIADAPAGTDWVVKNQRLYTYCREEGVRIYSLSKTNVPTLAGEYMNSDVVNFAVNANYMAIVDDAGNFKIIDVSRPESPVEKSNMRFPGNGEVIHISDTAAYMKEDSKLRIFDITDIKNPVDRGKIQFTRTIIDQVGNENYLYCEVDSVDEEDYPDCKLEVVKIKDPIHPVLCREIAMPETYGMCISGKRLYGLSENHLLIYDLSDPAFPKLIGKAALQWGICVAVSGDFAYVAEYDDQPCINVYNIKDAAKVSLVKQLKCDFEIDLLKVSGDRLYAAGQQFKIFDISDPKNPIRAGSYRSESDSFSGMAIDGSVGYVVWGGRLYVFSLADAQKPELVYKSDSKYGNPIAVYTRPDGTVAVICGTRDETYTRTGIDIFQSKSIPPKTEPPLAIKNISLINKISVPVSRIEVSGNYICGIDSSKLYVIDIANPANPIVRGSAATTYAGVDLSVDGKKVYVASNDGLYCDSIDVFDFSNPRQPTKLGSRDVVDDANYAIAAYDGIAITATLNDLNIFNVKNPGNIDYFYSSRETIHSYSIGSITLEGKLAYLYDSRIPGLAIFDLSKPSQPVPRGFFPGDMLTRGAFVIHNGFAYMVDDHLTDENSYSYCEQDGNFAVIDVSNPDRPVLRGKLPIWIENPSLAASDGLAYIGSSSNGVQVVDVSAPTAPQISGWYSITGTVVTDIACANSYIYACLKDSQNGNQLAVFKYNPTLSPLTVSAINMPGYAVSYLRQGNLVYTDRTYQFTGTIPAHLYNQTYLQTCNNDKARTGSSFLTFIIDRASTIYIALDARITTPPAWLRTWTKISDTLTITDPSGPKRVLYKKHFPAGKITLGANDSGTTGYCMYSVILVPDPKNSAATWLRYE